MSNGGAYTKKVVEGKYTVISYDETLGTPLLEEKVIKDDGIICLEQTKDLEYKVGLAVKLQWIIVSSIAVLLLSLNANWKSIINNMIETMFVICLLSTLYLIGLVEKDKEIITELETKIDEMQKRGDLVSNERKQPEVEESLQVMKLLDKLRKKEQVEIELRMSVEHLTKQLELSNAAGTTPETRAVLKDVNIELLPTGMSRAPERKKPDVEDSLQVMKLLDKLRKKERVEIELKLSIEELTKELELSKEAGTTLAAKPILKGANGELQLTGMSRISKSLSELVGVYQRPRRKSTISKKLAQISLHPQQPRRKHSIISTSLAEITVDPTLESPEFRKSKHLLAENTSVLIEDLRKKLRELGSQPQ